MQANLLSLAAPAACSHRSATSNGATALGVSAATNCFAANGRSGVETVRSNSEFVRSVFSFHRPEPESDHSKSELNRSELESDHSELKLNRSELELDHS